MSTVRVDGIASIDALAGRVEGADARLLARALNREMDKERTGIRRSITSVTGAPYSRVVRVTKTRRATPGGLAYTVTATDEFLPLSAFRAREVRSGVTAAPWGERRLFFGAFMKGGRLQERIAVPKLGGNVFAREGAARLPIVKLWGPSIPREMTREGGDPIETWRQGVGRLQERIVREVKRQIEAGQ